MPTNTKTRRLYVPLTREAGKAGYDLEAKLGNPAMAGRAIYRASTGRSPYFYASNERALEDIKRCAAEAAQGAT